VSKFTLSQIQKDVFLKVVRKTVAKGWYRAETSGERVTLVSLQRYGLLIRRVWRGNEGEANTAREYQAAPIVLETLGSSKG
jgi:hypothetical protein